jgi:CheY-like chemotaxis protein
MRGKKPPVVLLVEDSPDDVDFARRALARSGIDHRLVIAEQGDRALALLRGTEAEPGHGRPLRPALVLLDLNIPGIGGRELLERVKGDCDLRAIPVVVLSTSQHRSDIESCYRAGANSYHAKADDLTEYQFTARRIMEYWLSSVVPSHGAPELQSESVGGTIL